MRQVLLAKSLMIELLKDYDMSILYHPSKTNVVADTLNRKASSMWSLTIIQVKEQLLARDVQRLDNELVRL